jgi:hypothetical protein
MLAKTTAAAKLAGAVDGPASHKNSLSRWDRYQLCFRPRAAPLSVGRLQRDAGLHRGHVTPHSFAPEEVRQF